MLSSHLAAGRCQTFKNKIFSFSLLSFPFLLRLLYYVITADAFDFWFLIWRLRFEIFMASTWSIFYYKFIYAWIFYSISEFLLQEAVKAWIFSQISPFSTFVRVNLCHLFGYCNDSSKGLYKQKNSWIGKRKAHWIYLWEQKLGKVDYLRGQRIRYIWIPATSFYIRSISGALTSSPWKSH